MEIDGLMVVIPMTDPDGAAMVCHGSHQYTPVMLAYIYIIPAPWIRHGTYYEFHYDTSRFTIYGGYVMMHLAARVKKQTL